MYIHTQKDIQTKSSGILRLISLSTNLAFADGVALVAIAVFIVLFGRIYGAEELGKISFAVAISSIAQTICDAGFDISLPRSISRAQTHAYQLTHDALRVKLFLCLVVLPLVLLTTLVKDSATVLTSFFFVLDVVPSTFSSSLSASLRGLNKSVEAARIAMLYNILPIALCVGLVFADAPMPLFAVVILLGDILKYFRLQKLFNESIPEDFSIRELLNARIFDIQLLLTSYYEQRGVTLTNFFSSLLVRTPSVMLGWFATNAQHGVYAAASRFFTALRILPGAVINVLIPEYSQRTIESPRIRTVLIASIVTAILCASFLFFGAPLLIHFTFDYNDSIGVLKILAIAFAGLFLKTTLEGFLLAAQREKLVNLILGVVSLGAVVAYAVAAHSSPITVAYIVAVSEWSLCICFFLLFVFMKLQRHHNEQYSLHS